MNKMNKMRNVSSLRYFHKLEKKYDYFCWCDKYKITIPKHSCRNNKKQAKQINKKTNHYLNNFRSSLTLSNIFKSVKTEI